MRIPAAFATYDQCSQERDGSMSYNVQAAFLPEGFFRRPGHLPNIPEGWNNMMKKAAKVQRKIWEENKEISEKGRQGSNRNVEEETTRSLTFDYARRVLDNAILEKSFDELSLN